MFTLLCYLTVKNNSYPELHGTPTVRLKVLTLELLAVGAEKWLTEFQPVPRNHKWRDGNGKMAPISLPGKH